jgi:hypothetical protein
VDYIITLKKKNLMITTSKVLKNLLEKLLNEKKKGLILHIVMSLAIIQECAKELQKGNLRRKFFVISKYLNPLH